MFGTHSLRRTKATLIYRRTGNLRAVQLLLGHTKIESTVRYLGIEVDDALARRANRHWKVTGQSGSALPTNVLGFVRATYLAATPLRILSRVVVSVLRGLSAAPAIGDRGSF
jgi:hypothetical protein